MNSRGNRDDKQWNGSMVTTNGGTTWPQQAQQPTFSLQTQDVGVIFFLFLIFFFLLLAICHCHEHLLTGCL
jgi:hypothetical protein